MTVQTPGGETEKTLPLPKRDLSQAMRRGAFCTCPRCGKGRLFEGYLKVRPVCDVCGEELYHHRADDAPPYFTILILGHILISIVLGVEVAFAPPMWLHMLIWIPFTTITALAMLRPIKGALVGLQWALYMHGFDPNSEDDFAQMARGSGEAHGA